MLGDFSSEESETVQYSDEEDAGGYFVFNGDFALYQGEPLASSEDDMEDNGADEEEDEDGILPSVLEQPFERGVVANNWYAVIHAFYYFFSLTQGSSLHFSIVRCKCGNCNVEHLVRAREYRCCLEVNEVRGKFTFVEKNIPSRVSSHYKWLAPPFEILLARLTVLVYCHHSVTIETFGLSALQMKQKREKTFNKAL